MTRCARCDWRSDPDLTDEEGNLIDAGTQAVWHAEDKAHPLCSCGRSLTDTEPRTCDRCVNRVRDHLAGILTMWAELPRHLGRSSSSALDKGRSGGDEHKLPGGSVLVLLGPGRTGGESRFGPDHDAVPDRWWLTGGAVGPLTPAAYRELERIAEGREHAIDNQPDDGMSVAWTLVTWETDIRATRGDEDAPIRGRTSAEVRGAADYLMTYLRWAANQHDAFTEFADDLRKLHARLMAVTGRSEVRETAEAKCFECSGSLIREVTERGYADDWTCQGCGSSYDQIRYRLALRMKLAAS